jgi:UDP-GlcNAc:undecaprenyl-phosphate GlcNAc-1-phosphate transferase
MATALPAFLVMLAAVLLSAALVPAARSLALRFGVMDAPGQRKVHAAPTPRLGGLAVFAAFTAIVLAGYVLAPWLGAIAAIETHFAEAVIMLQEAYRVRTKLLGVLGGAAIAFAVGLADDVLGRRFHVGLKLLGQFLAASVLLLVDVRTSFMPYDWMNAVVTLLWVVGITNAFNLLDNMDGLSAGVAFAASGVLLVNAWLLGEFFISLLLVAFMGSLLGFLAFNWHPASVFLGDCGSLFIGYTMASITLLERYVSHAPSHYFAVLMPVLILAVPILDTATVVVIRIREKRPIYVGDSRHLSHRLVSLGMPPRLAVLLIYLVTVSLGLGAVSLADANGPQTVLILLQSGAIVAVVMILLFFERRTAPRRETA